MISISVAVDYQYRPPVGLYLAAALGLSIFALGGLAVLGLAKLAVQKKEAREVIGLLPWDLPPIYFLVAAQFGVLAWAKSALPVSVGFTADPFLAAFDRAIFGVDPWTLLQWLPPQLMDLSYITWAQSTMIGIAILPMLPRSQRRDRAILAFFIVMAACAMGQYLLPSAGPIFYERLGLGDRFADLPSRPWAQVTSDYLWANYLAQGSKIGGGISAFPSLHVAGAAWLALVIRSYERRAAPFAFAYLALILMGSVYLGWHYAADGIAGIAIAVAAMRGYQVRVRAPVQVVKPDQL